MAGTIAKDEQFDWVKERAACSLFAVYQQIVHGVEEDVKKRNAMRAGPPFTYGFRFITHPDDAVSIILEGERLQRHAVKIRCTESSIDVEHDSLALINAVVTLDDEGVCCLRVKDRLYSFWQFRRMALEKLLFEYMAPESK
jgi:hypothetical protein